VFIALAMNVMGVSSWRAGQGCVQYTCILTIPMLFFPVLFSLCFWLIVGRMLEIGFLGTFISVVSGRVFNGFCVFFFFFLFLLPFNGSLSFVFLFYLSWFIYLFPFFPLFFIVLALLLTLDVQLLLWE
jgi:hypothetical protein